MVQLSSAVPSASKREKRALAASRTQSAPSAANTMPSALESSPGPEPRRPMVRSKVPLALKDADVLRAVFVDVDASVGALGDAFDP